MEEAPPVWFGQVQWYFIIGGPKPRVGYFASDDFFVWGAGMVIRRANWLRLRELGFSARRHLTQSGCSKTFNTLIDRFGRQSASCRY